MSAPSPSSASPRADLALTLEAYDLEASRQGFVGPKLFPVFETPRPSGTYRILGADQLLQEHPTERAPDGSYNRADFTTGEKSYATQERGFEVPVDDNLAAQYFDYLDAEIVATEIARDVVLRANEMKAVAPAQDPTKVGATHVSAVKWNLATADPIGDMRLAKNAVRKYGFTPNVAVMEWEAFERLRESSQIMDKLASSGSADPKVAMLAVIAQILGIDEILVANSHRNAAIPSQDAAKAKLDLQPLWDKTKVFVGYRDRRNRLMYPTFGRTFHWTADGSRIGGLVETYRDERVRGDVVRVRNQVDVSLVMPECGYLITGVL